MSCPIHQTRFDFDFIYPALVEPLWKTQVDRWYQLDAPAYGIAEFYQTHALELGAHPNLIFIASPEASNATDRQFVESGAVSPAKFVHTLPNIRLSPLCQIMNWNGPVLCLQNGGNSFESTVSEAKHWVDDATPVVWVLSVHHFRVTACRLEMSLS